MSLTTRTPLAQIGKKDPKCRVCKRQFKRRRVGEVVCSVKCSIEKTKADQVARACAPYRPKPKKNTKARRELLKRDRPHQVSLTQAVINKYVVYVQERGKPCYTCGKVFDENKPGGVIDCGHWLTRGARPDRARDTRQMRRQCVNCNQYNGGRPAIFEKNLIAELGQEVVDEIRGPSSGDKVTCDDLIEMRKHYARLLREAGM